LVLGGGIDPRRGMIHSHTRHLGNPD
jgi:hypothetical protein